MKHFVKNILLLYNRLLLGIQTAQPLALVIHYRTTSNLKCNQDH
jgi:hypothetical protein